MKVALAAIEHTETFCREQVASAMLTQLAALRSSGDPSFERQHDQWPHHHTSSKNGASRPPPRGFVRIAASNGGNHHYSVVVDEHPRKNGATIAAAASADNSAPPTALLLQELESLRALQVELRHRDAMRDRVAAEEQRDNHERCAALERRLDQTAVALREEKVQTAALRAKLRTLCMQLRPPRELLLAGGASSSSRSGSLFPAQRDHVTAYDAL